MFVLFYRSNQFQINKFILLLFPFIKVLYIFSYCNLHLIANFEVPFGHLQISLYSFVLRSEFQCGLQFRDAVLRCRQFAQSRAKPSLTASPRVTITLALRYHQFESLFSLVFSGLQSTSRKQKKKNPLLPKLFSFSFLIGWIQFRSTDFLPSNNPRRIFDNFPTHSEPRSD